MHSSYFFPRFGALEHEANRTLDISATFIGSRRKSCERDRMFVCPGTKQRPSILSVSYRLNHFNRCSRWGTTPLQILCQNMVRTWSLQLPFLSLYIYADNNNESSLFSHLERLINIVASTMKTKPVFRLNPYKAKGLKFATRWKRWKICQQATFFFQTTSTLILIDTSWFNLVFERVQL